MKRPYGTGHIYEKWGSYYARRRTSDGRHLNRRIGPKRSRGRSDGLTRAEAEQAFRRIQAEEASRRPVEPVVKILTVDQVADRLRERIASRARASPTGELPVDAARGHLAALRRIAEVSSEDVERLASWMLARGASPKTVRNVMTFLHSVFGLAGPQWLGAQHPVEDAARPKRRHVGDADPDLRFLTQPRWIA